MKGIVFDLDGTLVDSLPEIAAAANAVMAARGLPDLPLRQVARFVGLGEQVFVDRMIAAVGIDLADRPDVMQRFMAAYKIASQSSSLMPGVATALEALKARGVPMGLCTNKPGGPLQAVLDSAGLRQFLAAIVAGDTLKVRKPDPAPLLLAFDQLGAQPGLYVGDSETDAETAQRAGIPFALYTEGIRQKAVDEIPHDIAFSDFARLSEVAGPFL